MKTIFIAVYSGRDIRDILRTDVLKKLKSNEIRIVLLSPAADDEDFIREFAGDNVVIEKLHPAIGKLEHAFIMLMHALFANTKFSETFKIKYENYKLRGFSGTRMSLTYLPRKFLSRFVSYRNKRLRGIFRKLNILLFPDRRYGELFEKYKPSLVFATHTFHAADIPVLKRAIKNKVPTVLMIPSWDNLTSKGEISVKVDKLIVWNKIMKKEARELCNYPAKDVYVSGAPQFDIYFKKDDFPSREQFFREIGADTSKKILTYTIGSRKLFPNELEIIEIINEAIDANKFIYPCQLLVRRYPNDYPHKDLLEKIKHYKNVIIQRLDYFSNNLPGRWSPKKDDMIHLASTMLYSDVVLNFASTTTIDACAFNTPVVNIGFDGYQKKTYLDSVIRYYDYTHYKNIVETGGVRIAKNKEKLLEYINMYLENPKLDSAGRRRIVEEQCYYTDGQSGERVAKYILEYLKECENKK